MSMIDLHEVSKVYRSEVMETHALSPCSLQVDAGEFVAVTGPSGSGKTTFLNLLGLLDNFDQGTYHLDSRPVHGLADRELSRLRNEKIGFVFQSFNLMPDLDVVENVELPLRYRNVSAKTRRDAAYQALERVGLKSRHHHFPNQLSGGQQQRVAIARAIAGSPAILLADEPTGNLDSARAQGIMDLLGELNGQGMTIIMVTHSQECAARASRLLHILDGHMSDLRQAEMRADHVMRMGAVPAFSYQPHVEDA